MTSTKERRPVRVEAPPQVGGRLPTPRMPRMALRRAGLGPIRRVGLGPLRWWRARRADRSAEQARADTDELRYVDVTSDPPVVASADVHPRIARRRAEVRRESRSWRRRLRWAPVACAGLATVVVAGLFSPLVDMDHLEVSGVGGASAESVVEVVGLDVGTALFGIRPSEVRSRVESLPWVAHADVDVIWPDRVTVAVTPHRPVALIGSPDGGESVLTSSAAVLARADAGPLWPYTADLPRLVLPAGSGEPIGTEVALDVLAQLRDVTSSLLTEVRVSGDGGVSLDLRLPGSSGTVEVDIGSHDDLPAKAMALDSVLDGTVDQECIDGVDVSVPTRVTLQRSTACTVPVPDSEDPAMDAPRSGGGVDD